MKSLKTMKSLMPGVILILSLSACNGIMGGMYDEPAAETENDYGFIKVDESANSGVVYINASEYTNWNFIDFHKKKIETVEIGEGMQEPVNWDIAVHRYDTKTNNGVVLETEFTDFGALKALGSIPDGAFVADIWTTDRIAVDMSGMMDGVILYTESYYNPELSKWLNVDTSTMPPIYTMSKKVYLVRLKDGTYAALRLSNFMNEASVKGYMTIEYMYPFEFEN
ncbi:MAG: HmuY family protein [Muribaculaceae bacterium]|nr:HmuY family protein [Muribaculaceae bacterium]